MLITPNSVDRCAFVRPWHRSRHGRNRAAGLVDGQDQAEAIENRVGQHQVLEDGRRHRLHQAALRGLGPPDFGQQRCIVVSKRSILDQRSYPTLDRRKTPR